MIFEGGILGGMSHFWGDPYLNSTTVLFDMYPPAMHDYNSSALTSLQPFLGYRFHNFCHPENHKEAI